MSKIFTNIYPVTDLYKKMSAKSETVTQMIYGDSFSIIKKTRKWLKIKIQDDNYKGYIKNKAFNKFIKPTHKIHVLKAKIYKFPNKKSKIDELTFGSKIKISKERGAWKEVIVNQKTYLTMITFHPAYLLRQPDQKKYSWSDLKEIRKKIDELDLTI